MTPRAVEPRIALTSGDLGKQGDMAYGLAISPDSRLVAVAGVASKGGGGRGAEGGASVWDLATRKKVAAIPGTRNSDVNAVAFSPDGKLLAVGDFGAGVVIWDLAAGKQARAIDARLPGAGERAGEGGAPALFGLRFSPGGRSLVVFPSEKGRVRAWDVATGRREGAWITANDLEVSSLAFDPAGHALGLGFVIDSPEGGGLVGNEPARLVLWDFAAGRAAWSRSPVSPITSAHLSADGRRVALIDQSRDDPKRPPSEVLLLDPASGKTVATFRAPGPLNSTALGPDGRLLASIVQLTPVAGKPGGPSELQLADATTGRPLARIIAHEVGDNSELAFSSDSRSIGASFGDGGIKVWDVAKILGGEAPHP